MERENLSPTKFAEILKIQPSNISHLLSGRNKPSFELLQKITEAFPNISGDWLLTGQGNYVKGTNTTTLKSPISGEFNKVPSLFDQIKPISAITPVIPPDLDVIGIKPPVNTEKTSSASQQLIPNPEKVKKIIIIYDDNSFEELNPKNFK